jgi:hypothetical protein
VIEITTYILENNRTWTIAKFQKKNLLTKDEADELIKMLGEIMSKVVK